MVDVAEAEIYAKQSDGVLSIPIKRSVTSSNVLVAWRIISADPDSPYSALSGELDFDPSENVSYVRIQLEKEAQPLKKSEFELAIEVKEGAVGGRTKCRVVIANDLKQSVVAVKSPTDGSPIEFKQSDHKCYLHVTRRECASERISVPWHVTSKDHNSVWNSVQGTVVFQEGQYESVIEVDMPQVNSTSPVEELDLVLDQPEGRAQLDSHLRACSFKVINDVGSGLVEFGSPTYLVDSSSTNKITLIRTRGVAFVSVVEWEAVQDTAKEDEHFSPGHGSVLFGVGQSTASIPITVHNDPTGKPCSFR